MQEGKRERREGNIDMEDYEGWERGRLTKWQSGGKQKRRLGEWK